MRCVTIRYEKLWLSFVMGSCFVVVVLFFLFFLPTHRKQLQPQRQLLCPGKNEDDSVRVSQSAGGQRVTALGWSTRPSNPRFTNGSIQGFVALRSICRPFYIAFLSLSSSPVSVCLSACLSFFDFTSSRHTHSHTYTTLNHALYASGHRVASACCIFFILGLFIYLFIFAFFAYTKKTSKNSHRFCMHFTRCFLWSALLAARDR